MNTPRTLSLPSLVQRPAPYVLQRRTAPWPSLYKEHLKYPSYPNLQHVLVKKKATMTRIIREGQMVVVYFHALWLTLRTVLYFWRPELLLAFC